MGRYVGGPYQEGKLYCAFCGEYRRSEPEYKEVVPSPKHAKPSCAQCGYQIRLRGRHWHHYAKNPPKRY